ncbi:hypothetical protein SAPIO_CDS9651 [Scedosporium apiospermum]|uniref:DUF3955 domain-containing protein n=1 Tax=Pseudallescheria apiosperma TaxID=563466 RepID=A0A084FX88_PSEDA|nr:uncharacterized protein SAPIO_CDS9651 [Scedosporium apiospermum]KEZ39700.1 hypothetical protein SAPIO_CDS9651 [Scedosporium apiospermum]
MAANEPILYTPADTEPREARLSTSVGRPSSDGHRLSMQSSTRKYGGAHGLLARLGLGGVARRTLGICLLLVTVFLWTLANFLASSIYSDNTYDKPFLVVYVNSSAFAISLGVMTIRYIIKNGWPHFKSEAAQVWQEYKTGVRSRIPTIEDDDLTVGEQLLGDEDGSLEIFDPQFSDDGKLTFLETAKLSLEFSMLWFSANYFASACLEYTSVGSVTILTSTSSVWTLIFCALMRVESFSTRKLIGVLASLAGVVLISTVDLTGSNEENRGSFPHKTLAQIAIGDSMAFVSAIIYGLYVTVMKLRVGDEDRVNMPLFFGLVGVYCLVLLWPLFFVLHFTGLEPFVMPPSAKIWAIVLGNSVASFVSDISWAYAMLLTTPLVVTVGLSLTIPLSLIGEMIQYSQYSSVVYWIGAAVVFVSFLFINHESHEDPASKAQESVDGV